MSHLCNPKLYPMLQFYSQARTYLRSTDLGFSAGTTGCFDQQSNTHTTVRGKCHQTRDAKHKMSLFGQIELPSHNFLLEAILLPIYYDDVTSYAGRARTRACALHMHGDWLVPRSQSPRWHMDTVWGTRTRLVFTGSRDHDHVGVDL